MHRFIITAVVGLLLSSFAWSYSAAPFNDREYKIKAAFLANFIRYTQWQALPKESFRFCSSNTRVNQIFIKELSQETWFNLKPEFKLVTLETVSQCDLLFVDKLSSVELKTLLTETSNSNMLIISEKRKEAQLYSHINFFFTDNKLRFEINVERLKTSHLTMHASLLRLARITSSQGGQHE